MGSHQRPPSVRAARLLLQRDDSPWPPPMLLRVRGFRLACLFRSSDTLLSDQCLGTELTLRHWANWNYVANRGSQKTIHAYGNFAVVPHPVPGRVESKSYLPRRTLAVRNLALGMGTERASLPRRFVTRCLHKVLV